MKIVTSFGFKDTSKVEKELYGLGTMQLNFPRSCLHWRLSDYAETTMSLFRIFCFCECVCFTSLATDSKSFLPPANCWFYTVVFFFASSLEVLQLAYLNWWKIPEVLLLTNGWIVDFSCSHSISLHGSWISYTHWSAENMQCVKIKHRGKNETDKHVDLLFVWHIFPGFSCPCTHILTRVTYMRRLWLFLWVIWWYKMGRNCGKLLDILKLYWYLEGWLHLVPGEQ